MAWDCESEHAPCRLHAPGPGREPAPEGQVLPARPERGGGEATDQPAADQPADQADGIGGGVGPCGSQLVIEGWWGRSSKLRGRPAPLALRSGEVCLGSVSEVSKLLLCQLRPRAGERGQRGRARGGGGGEGGGEAAAERQAVEEGLKLLRAGDVLEDGLLQHRVHVARQLVLALGAAPADRAAPLPAVAVLGRRECHRLVRQKVAGAEDDDGGERAGDSEHGHALEEPDEEGVVARAEPPPQVELDGSLPPQLPVDAGEPAADAEAEQHECESEQGEEEEGEPQQRVQHRHLLEDDGVDLRRYAAKDAVSFEVVDRVVAAPLAHQHVKVDDRVEEPLGREGCALAQAVHLHRRRLLVKGGVAGSDEVLQVERVGLDGHLPPPRHPRVAGAKVQGTPRAIHLVLCARPEVHFGQLHRGALCGHQQRQRDHVVLVASGELERVDLECLERDVLQLDHHAEYVGARLEVVAKHRLRKVNLANGAVDAPLDKVRHPDRGRVAAVARRPIPQPRPGDKGERGEGGDCEDGEGDQQRHQHQPRARPGDAPLRAFVVAACEEGGEQWVLVREDDGTKLAREE
mmetsp:Transcript_17182/g.55242  ORF Transcript_17182/g.55242 Transcript_17182/m.55242 type:complete len:576 (-) Transcript_17182:326-2053(-)